MTENTIKEYFEQMKNDLCIAVEKVIDEKFGNVEKKNNQNFERMQEENNRNFERMQQENDKKFENILKQMDERFKNMLDQMNARLEGQDKEIISIKKSLAVIEEEHGRKLDVLYETRVNNIEKEIENAMRIQKLEARVQNLEYKQFNV